MIDCFGKHKLENRKGQSLEEVYNEAIKGRDESEHRAIANKVALDFHKELFNEMEVLKKQVKGQSFKPSKYESPDKSDVVKKITDEYNEKINALEKEVTQDTNTPTTTGKEQPLVTDPTSKGEGAKGKFEEKARRLAEKIMNTDIVPDWLKIDDANVDTKGASAEQVKKALADATIKMGKLLDKGVEFSEAVKEAVKDLVDLVGINKKDDIEKGFKDYYKENTGTKKEGAGDKEDTKMANAVNDAFIEGKFGVEAIDKIISQLKDTDLKNIYETVKDKIKRGVLDVKKVRDRLLTTKRGNEQDQAVLLYDLAELKAKESNLIKEINKETDGNAKKELQVELLQVQNDMMDNALANRHIGRSASTIFRLRQLWVNRDADIVKMQEEYKASKGLDRLTPEQEAEIKAQYDEITGLKSKIDELKVELDKQVEENAKLITENERLEKLKEGAQKQKKSDRGKKSEEAIKKSNERVQKAKDELKKLRSGLNDITKVVPEAAAILSKIAAEKVYQGVVKLNELVRNVYDEIKDVFPEWKEEDVRAALFPKANAEQYYKARTELEKSSKDLKSKVEDYRKLQKEYAIKMFEWQKDRRMDVMKDRPMKERIIDGILRWQRFAVLSYPSTIAKLVAVVGQQLTLKPLKFVIQKGIAEVTKLISPELAKKQTLWGNPTAKALGKYYSALIKNFSLANLKEQFSGVDVKEIMYGDKYMYDEWVAAKGLLEMPGRSHGYIKSFIKNPEFAFAHEQVSTSYISKMAEIENKLKDEHLSSEERIKLEDEYKQYDITNEDVMEKINNISLEHGKWSILMNNNKFTDKFQKWTRESGITGAVMKSELPIVKIPTNYVGRYFAVKYGLIRAITGRGRWEVGKTDGKQVEGNFPGIAELIIKGTKDLKPEQADLLGRALNLGTMGASFFALGYLGASQIKENDDHSYSIFGVRISNNLIHSPEIESILSGAHVSHKMDEDTGFIKSMIDSDIDIVKKNPFVSMLQYGAVPILAQALFMKNKDRAATQAEDAIYNKITGMVVPGFVKQTAGAMDTPNGFSINEKPIKRWPKGEGLDRFWEHVEMTIPGLRQNVPMTKQNDWTEEDKKNPVYKTFIDAKVELPNTNPKSIEVDFKEGKPIKLSDKPQDIQDKYIETKGKYVKDMLKELYDGDIEVYIDEDGRVSIPTDYDGKQGKESVEFKKLTPDQLKEAVSQIGAKATKKTKEEMFPKD